MCLGGWDDIGTTAKRAMDNASDTSSGRHNNQVEELSRFTASTKATVNKCQCLYGSIEYGTEVAEIYNRHWPCSLRIPMVLSSVSTNSLSSGETLSRSAKRCSQTRQSSTGRLGGWLENVLAVVVVAAVAVAGVEERPSMIRISWRNTGSPSR
jgi:hypothetical protein